MSEPTVHFFSELKRMGPAEKCLVLMAVNKFGLELRGPEFDGEPLGTFRYVGQPRVGLAPKNSGISSKTLSLLVTVGSLKRRRPGEYAISLKGKRSAQKWLERVNERAEVRSWKGARQV